MLNKLLIRFLIALLFTSGLHGQNEAERPAGWQKARADSGPGWRSLFDGKTLDGWQYRGRDSEDSPRFTVENGAIVGRTVMPWNSTAFVCTTEQFKDFELEFEVKVTGDLNSGVQIRSTPEGAVRGAQVEIENGYRKTGYIFGQGMGMWLSEEAEITKNNASYRSGEWNRIRVLARGRNIKTWINGHPAADTTHEKIALEGVIGLQVHAYPRGEKKAVGAKEILTASWRNIRIRELE